MLWGDLYFTLDVKMHELCSLITWMRETTLLPTNGPVTLTQPSIQKVPKGQRVELTTHPYPVPTLRNLGTISSLSLLYIFMAECLIKRKENITVN
jgi:hypothetical protein